MYQHIKVPAQGQKITVNADMSLNVIFWPWAGTLMCWYMGGFVSG